MRTGIHPQRANRSPRARVLAVAALVGGLLVAGCGGSSPGPTATTSAGATRSHTSAATAGLTRQSTGAPDALAFARCMRSNGAPDFPDPAPGGGFAFSTGAGFDPSSPAVKAARAKCQRFAPQPPGSDGGGSSFPPQVKAHALAQLRSVGQCMRQHGISNFPDPRTTPPPNLSLGEYSEITDYQGVFLLFPAAVDMQSPAWERAAAACGGLAESFNHPHH